MGRRGGREEREKKTGRNRQGDLQHVTADFWGRSGSLGAKPWLVSGEGLSGAGGSAGQWPPVKTVTSETPAGGEPGGMTMCARSTPGLPVILREVSLPLASAA